MHLACMQLAPRLREGLHGLGMHNQMLVHLCAAAGPKRFADLATGLSRATDHAVCSRIDDRNLDAGMFGDFTLHGINRRLDTPIGPVRRDVRAPRLFCRFELAADMALIHGGIGNLVQQSAGITPEAESEQRVALAKRQAERRIRLETEKVQQQDCVCLAHQRASAQLFKFR